MRLTVCVCVGGGGCQNFEFWYPLEFSANMNNYLALGILGVT